MGAYRSYEKLEDNVNHWQEEFDRCEAGLVVYTSTFVWAPSLWSDLKGKFAKHGRKGTNLFRPTPFHEPEDNMTAETFKKHWGEIASMARDTFEIGPCFMAYDFGHFDAKGQWVEAGPSPDWTVTKDKTGKWVAPFQIDPTMVDFITCDVYRHSESAPVWSKGPLEAFRQVIRSWGFDRWGIMEWGVQIGTYQAASISDMASYQKTHPKCEVLTYYDTSYRDTASASYDNWIHDKPESVKAFIEVQKAVAS